MDMLESLLHGLEEARLNRVSKMSDEELLGIDIESTVAEIVGNERLVPPELGEARYGKAHSVKLLQSGAEVDGGAIDLLIPVTQGMWALQQDLPEDVRVDESDLVMSFSALELDAAAVDAHFKVRAPEVRKWAAERAVLVEGFNQRLTNVLAAALTEAKQRAERHKRVADELERPDF